MIFISFVYISFKSRRFADIYIYISISSPMPTSSFALPSSLPRPPRPPRPPRLHRFIASAATQIKTWTADSLLSGRFLQSLNLSYLLRHREIDGRLRARLPLPVRESLSVDDRDRDRQRMGVVGAIDVSSLSLSRALVVLVVPVRVPVDPADPADPARYIAPAAAAAAAGSSRVVAHVCFED